MAGPPFSSWNGWLNRSRPCRRAPLAGDALFIVEARYDEFVAALLFEGAKAALEAAGAALDVVRVTGAPQISSGLAIALQPASADGRPYDGALRSAASFAGDPSFEIVAAVGARADGHGGHAPVALGNGVLTVETPEQAEERADPKRGDKGGDAARAALTLARSSGGAPR